MCCKVRLTKTPSAKKAQAKTNVEPTFKNKINKCTSFAFAKA
jgi:hypothetical protein